MQYGDIVMSMRQYQRKQASTREGMIVTTIALDKDVHRILAVAAAEGNTVMTEIVRQAIDEWLAKRGRSASRARAQGKGR